MSAIDDLLAQGTARVTVSTTEGEHTGYLHPDTLHEHVQFALLSAAPDGTRDTALCIPVDTITGVRPAYAP